MYLLAVILAVIGLIMGIIHIFADLRDTNETIWLLFRLSQVLMFISLLFLVMKAGSKRRENNK
ncbi:Uncharacterised protein [Niallia circulans]|jgi:predicted membrane channel-forming protein YqfA (hemolysin III family)|uniref:hypothetical protein n=1 Tax=Shouchella clausii TaxID=79880 RepID=UPI000B96878F|nr:hypothetical protein [Shouchella clausii]SPU18143.1 Uncharacterised protein [Niallia circulans]AST95746.1 hypothetical protein BC8716_07210 [Shouchella clausii]MCM3547913.1 hypothetical protein [Shouchella clausii]MCR1288987.1 hypothetical protein [Shouchella clausii]MEB5472152.1 hypothetical protein [Shouchella clausii]